MNCNKLVNFEEFLLPGEHSSAQVSWTYVSTICGQGSAQVSWTCVSTIHGHKVSVVGVHLHPQMSS